MPTKSARLYRLTDEQYTRLLDACKPVPYIIAGGLPPPSQRERANAEWQRVAQEHGVRWQTIRPADNGTDRDFLAEPAEKDKGELEP